MGLRERRYETIRAWPDFADNDGHYAEVVEAVDYAAVGTLLGGECYLQKGGCGEELSDMGHRTIKVCSEEEIFFWNGV